MTFFRAEPDPDPEARRRYQRLVVGMDVLIVLGVGVVAWLAYRSSGGGGSALTAVVYAMLARSV